MVARISGQSNRAQDVAQATSWLFSLFMDRFNESNALHFLFVGPKKAIRFSRRSTLSMMPFSFALSPRACSSLKSAANCSSSNFIRADAPQYPAAIEWIKTANKAERKYDPDGRPGIWVSLFWFQQGFRPSHETNIAERLPTAGARL